MTMIMRNVVMKPVFVRNINIIITRNVFSRKVTSMTARAVSSLSYNHNNFGDVTTKMPTGNAGIMTTIHCFSTTTTNGASDTSDSVTNHNLSLVQRKFVQMFLDCQEKNFDTPLFSRYIKEMVYAIDVNNDGMISESELLDMMEQFGIQDGMTTNEIQVLFDELGEVVQAQRNNDETIAKQIPTHTVEELILSHIR